MVCNQNQDCGIVSLKMQTQVDGTSGSNVSREVVYMKKNVTLSLRNESLPLEDYSLTPNR